MKKIIALFLFGLLFSCNAQKNSSTAMPTLSSECPQDGTCEVEILKNKQLILLHDELGGMYYDIKDQEGTTVIHYQYNRTTEANVQDGHYREDIIFEIKNSDTSLDLTDSALQQTKLIFGRHCFCKGQTGYFKIDQGNLKLTSNKKEVTFSLSLICEKVPQIITFIETKR
ncbi:hypothetical protein [Flavobacterium lacus]|uniref:Lipoprotein n=1 Tax=Flavobacterium lacus TaxID=1353778 RepID=A0A328X573_9FLAO|nr:hypothetical protein [Flavobacterium lacus]RAR50459.1 hypothetical protein B0I10_102264 [Flavobacterium lacus]